MVFRTLTRLVGRDLVDDLAQEVFLRLYRALATFRGDSQLSTYIYRITVNVAQDEWKRRRREREHIAQPTISDDANETHWIETLPGSAPSAEDSLLQNELWRSVSEELLNLTDIQRAVLVLYHQEECSYEHIALTLKIPIGTVRTHLHRGREKLSTLVRQRMNAKQPIPQTASKETASTRKGATA